MCLGCMKAIAQQQKLLPYTCARKLPDGSLELYTVEESAEAVSLLIQVRDEVGREAQRAAGTPLRPEDPLPEHYVMPVAFRSQCHKCMREKLAGLLWANWREGAKKYNERQAYLSHLHQVYNGKLVADLIFIFGSVEEEIVRAVNADIARTVADNLRERQQWEAYQEFCRIASSGGQAGEEPTKPARTPKTVATAGGSNAQARKAASMRRDVAAMQNKRTRYLESKQPEGHCSICNWWEAGAPRVRCMRCRALCCEGCQAPKHLLCRQCAALHGLGPLPFEGKLAEHERPLQCEGLGCGTQQQPQAACWKCNRWLCSGCVLGTPPVVRCVVCPVEEISSGALRGMSLEIPTRVPTEAQCQAAAAEAETASAAAGYGRISTGYGLGSRAEGAAHRVAALKGEKGGASSGGGSSSSRP